MKGVLRGLGIVFAVITVIMGVALLVKDYNAAEQASHSWLMVTVSGTLVFNGGYYYLKDKNRQGIVMAATGLVILVVAVSVFPF